MSGRIRPSVPRAERFPEPPKPIPPAPAPSPLTELEQIRRLPARELPFLPMACTLVGWHLPSRRGFWVTTSRQHHEAARAAQWPVLHGMDWYDCVRACAEGASVLAIGRWLIPRQPPPAQDGWPLGTLQALLGPARDELELIGSPSVLAEPTIGDVLDHFQCELVGVDPPLEALATTADARLL
jgi:hypothetical protein